MWVGIVHLPVFMRIPNPRPILAVHMIYFGGRAVHSVDVVWRFAVSLSAFGLPVHITLPWFLWSRGLV